MRCKQVLAKSLRAVCYDVPIKRKEERKMDVKTLFEMLDSEEQEEILARIRSLLAK